MSSPLGYPERINKTANDLTFGGSAHLSFWCSPRLAANTGYELVPTYPSKLFYTLLSVAKVFKEVFIV